MVRAFKRVLLCVVFPAFVLLAGTHASFAQEPSDAALITSFASPAEPPAYATAEQVIEAFKTALAADDFDKLAILLGLDPVKAKSGEGIMDTYGEIRAGAARKVVIRDLGDRKIVDIGDRLWPLPFPIVKGTDGKWAFDTYAGFEEIINRRIGENELQAIATMRAYVDAQREYFSADHDDDGVMEYAQKLISTDGKTDGLYWSPDLGMGDSPAGDAFESDAALKKAKASAGYFGYHYRIVTGQGSNIAGGKYDYIINDNMIAGFALVAWPIRYGETGVHTFAVNANGIIYQADLGAKTSTMASGIRQFNPGDSWEVVTD